MKSGKQAKFCDIQCKYASWPEHDSLDGSGSCRTFQALYCKKKDQLVYKNQPCPEKIEVINTDL